MLKKVNRSGFMIYSNTWYCYPSPKRWAVTELCLAAHSGNLTPPEDLSGLPPLVVSVAGQGYHCRRIGSWRNSLPVLLLDGWEPLAAFFGRL